MMQGLLASAGGGLGLGASNLLGSTMDALQMPRKLLWGLLGLPDTGEELANRLGLEGGLGQGVGLAAEMLLDPLNLVGAGLGAKAGRMLGESADVARAIKTGQKAVASELAGVNRVRGLAIKGLQEGGLYDDLAQAAAQGARQLEPNPLLAHLGSSYNPAVLAELPDVAALAKGKDVMRNFKRVDPAVSAAAQDMGIGYRTAEGTTLAQKPSFAKGSGGVLKPVGEGVGPLPGGYMDVLEGAAPSELNDLVASSRLGEPPLRYARATGEERSPLIRELLGGPDEVRELYEQTRGIGLRPDLQASNTRLLPGKTATESLEAARAPGGPMVPLIDLPLEEALHASNASLPDLMRRSRILNDTSNLSPMQRLLMRFL